MSRIDQALRRADAAARSQREPQYPVAERANVDVVLDEYPLEPPIPVVDARREAVSARRGAVRSERPRATAASRPVVEPPAHDVALTGDPRLVTAPQISGVWVEQYRRLAASLYQIQSDTSLRTVMVTSTLPREGKTLTVANLALTLSHSYAQRVLIIDADLRSPSIDQVLGIPNRTGLSDYLNGTVSEPPITAISPTLSVITGGGRTQNPIAGLVSDDMKHLLEAMSSKFDWLLLDTSPVGLLPDANLLARIIDGVVFVVGAAIAPYASVQRALNEVGADRVVGVVFNGASESAVPSAAQYAKYPGTSVIG